MAEALKSERCKRCGKDVTQATPGAGRCAGCHETTYCSEKCQIDAWRAEHTALCGEVTEAARLLHQAVLEIQAFYAIHGQNVVIGAEAGSSSMPAGRPTGSGGKGRRGAPKQNPPRKRRPGKEPTSAALEKLESMLSTDLETGRLLGEHIRPIIRRMNPRDVEALALATPLMSNLMACISAADVSLPYDPEAEDDELDDRLEQAISAARAKPQNEGMKVVVLLTTGSFNPVHKQHVKLFDVVARQLRANNVVVAAGLISPSHDEYVREKLGTDAIDWRLRCHLCALACDDYAAEMPDALPIFVDHWEGLQDGFVDFPDVIDARSEYISETFKDTGAELVYCCGADLYIKAGMSRTHKTNVAVINRPPYHAISVVSDPKRLFFVCADATEASDMSSTVLRRLIASVQPISDYTFPSVAKFLRLHRWLRI